MWLRSHGSCSFDCLFWGFPSHSRFFHLFGRVTITSEGWRTTSFDLYSALMAIEQWGFFNVPHLLWHKPSLYHGHLWGPVTITFVAERLALELSRPVLTTLLCPNWNWTLISCMLGERSTTKHIVAVSRIWYWASCLNLLQLTDWKYCMYILNVQWRFNFNIISIRVFLA